MSKTNPINRHGANLLTLPAILLLAFLLVSCSTIHEYYGESCKTHAYVRTVLIDYINTRFTTNAPVRLAVIPFSVPANISAQSAARPGLGNMLAWKVQAAMLDAEQVPIVEVFNRQDWPGKRDEFFTGNFGAIAAAREAGYDLVLLGLLEGIDSSNSMTVFSKLIEADSGMTLWYGKTTIHTAASRAHAFKSYIGLEDRRPDILFAPPSAEELAHCMVKEILSEKG